VATRVDALRRLLERNPDDARLRFGLAAEYEKLGQWEDVVEQLREYLSRAEDEGNAWGRLGAALTALGRLDEAREAYRRGVAAAERHHHPSMAAEFSQTLEDLS
jgi:E3 SUMO-protein ligase RanBP2